jgi:hypothetical protein
MPQAGHNFSIGRNREWAFTDAVGKHDSHRAATHAVSMNPVPNSRLFAPYGSAIPFRE